jgi:hypothetical protein
MVAGTGSGAKLGCIAPWDDTAPGSCSSGPDKPCPQDGGADAGADAPDDATTEAGPVDAGGDTSTD